VLLKPAAAGTGVIAGGAVRAVITACGVPNVLTKSIGRRNPHNVVKATIVALESLRDRNAVAEMRGLAIDKVEGSSNGRQDQELNWYRSPICTPEKQKRVVKGLGLRKLNQVVERPDTPVFRGMVKKVPHLLQVVE
jgi:ribosomal protein L30